MNGTLYAVGTGPGDPELMTLKAVRILRSADVIACPAKGCEPGLAFRIAEAAVPEIREKERILIRFPMTRDPEQTAAAHDEASERLLSVLRAGKDIAFLTLGDPTLFSTFARILSRIIAAGIHTEIVSGVPSFCAAAAVLLTPIAAENETLTVTTGKDPDLSVSGPLIIMKAGSALRSLKEKLRKSGRDACMAENCGLPDERLYRSLDAIPDEAGYFSLVIAPPPFSADTEGSEREI